MEPGYGGASLWCRRRIADGMLDVFLVEYMSLGCGGVFWKWVCVRRVECLDGMVEVGGFNKPRGKEGGCEVSTGGVGQNSWWSRVRGMEM